MTIVVEHADPRGAEARALLAASHRCLRSLFDREDSHFLEAEALAAPGVRFFVARLDGRPVGCAALAGKDGYGEVKSMFVDPAARRAGVGAALLARLEAEARAAGLPALRLETGDVLEGARALYRRSGFSERGPFGEYAPAARSVFMEKPLA